MTAATRISRTSRFDELQKLSERDTGPAIATLVRVSHIHLFGLGFIFFIVGLIFSHAYVRPIWLKSLVIATPFVCIALDVSAWYITKIFHPFAWVVMAGGAAYGAAFAFMWIVSMYQMWFAKAPSKVLERSRNVG